MLSYTRVAGTFFKLESFRKQHVIHFQPDTAAVLGDGSNKVAQKHESHKGDLQ